MKKLYYTVLILEGLIKVYYIEENQPKLLVEIDVNTHKYPEEEIQWWLDSNGYGDDAYEFEQL